MNKPHGNTLKSLNLKNTPKRLAILELLANATTYVSPEEIRSRLQSRFKSIGLPTIYRNLEELATGGIITKVIHPNRQLYYYFCPNQHHHHHFVCLNCRRVEDVDFCGMEALEREVSEKIGGTVLTHILQVNGLCHACSHGEQGDQP